MRIIVSGYMVRHPLVGNMLAFLNYVLGLRDLGHHVVYVEESGWLDSCYQPSTGEHTSNPTEGLQATESLLRRFGASVPVCYVDRDSGMVHGGSRARLKRWMAEADLLLNVGGACSLDEFGLCSRRAYIDMDPLFTQLGRFGCDDLSEYQAHFSYGANIGAARCSIPDAGFDWLPAVPPVVADVWRPDPQTAGECPPPGTASLTTICNWNAYGSVEHDSIRYGQKNEEFLKLIELPRRVSRKLELALAGAGPNILEQLKAHGWVVRDAGKLTAEWDTYRSYIQSSIAEFSVAKNAYVRTFSGWFSDRSVCYLASGRPVIIQDTGIGRWLPSNRAVLTFSTLEEAAERLNELEVDYTSRCREARDVVDNWFSHSVVLPSLVERAFESASGHRNPCSSTCSN
jgi:hypothetical protein